MNNIKTKPSKLLFYAIIVCLPINLGYHFLIRQAYVGGLLTDYLIPTIFGQDILVLLLLGFWFKEHSKNISGFIGGLFSTRYALLVYLFLLTVFLSTLLAGRFVSSFSAFIRLFLYALFSLYVSKEFDWKKDFRIISRIFAWEVLFLGLLGVAQWFKQGSVFHNYLFLGEQPYSFSTPGIVHENVLGFTKIPAYGLFRHPNIFGGFLVIAIVWIVYGVEHGWIKRKLFWPAFVLGVAALFATISLFSWIAFLLGMFLVFFSFSKRILLITFVVVALVFLASFFLPFLPVGRSVLENPSYLRRANLLSASYELIAQKNYVFGVGYNNFTAQVECSLPGGYNSYSHDLRFVQPVHNIFVLLAAECGLVCAFLFLLIWIDLLKSAFSRHVLLFISLLLILFLGCFDHYFITINQTLLLLWTFFGIAASSSTGYNEESP